MSKKFKFSDLRSAYLEEQLDRQAFWILKEIPELDHQNEKYKGKVVVDDKKVSEVCFKTGIAGFHITLLFNALNQFVLENGSSEKDLDKFCQDLDSNFGCLSTKGETLFQNKCFELQQVNSFLKYYPMLGVPVPDEEALRARLKTAIENSRRKRYHGDESSINEVPPLAKQAITYLEDKVKPFEYFNEETKEFLSAEDPKWKVAVLDKFSWIKSDLLTAAPGEELSPKQFAEIADNDSIEVKEFVNLKNKNDSLRRHITKQNHGDFITTV